MAKFNEYPAKTTPKDADKFMLYSAEDAANKLIDYDKLADAVLNKLTSKTFGLDAGTMTLPAALNQLNSNVKKDNIKYIHCEEYGTLAVFSIGKLLYCKFNGNDKSSEVKQQDIAQLPSEYTLESSIGAYVGVLVANNNIGSLKIDVERKVTLYCPYPYLYGYVIIPIK
jgi:hypothetical protein